MVGIATSVDQLSVSAIAVDLEQPDLGSKAELELLTYELKSILLVPSPDAPDSEAVRTDAQNGGMSPDAKEAASERADDAEAGGSPRIRSEFESREMAVDSAIELMSDGGAEAERRS